MPENAQPAGSGTTRGHTRPNARHSRSRPKVGLDPAPTPAPPAARPVRRRHRSSRPTARRAPAPSRPLHQRTSSDDASPRGQGGGRLRVGAVRRRIPQCRRRHAQGACFLFLLRVSTFTPQDGELVSQPRSDLLHNRHPMAIYRAPLRHVDRMVSLHQPWRRRALVASSVALASWSPKAVADPNVSLRARSTAARGSAATWSWWVCWSS